MTKPCICPDSPMPAIELPGMPESSKTPRIACLEARHQSSGCCSAQSGLNIQMSSWAAVKEWRTCPPASTSNAREPPVPTSIPSQYFMKSNRGRLGGILESTSPYFGRADRRRQTIQHPHQAELSRYGYRYAHKSASAARSHGTCWVRTDPMRQPGRL